MVEIPYEGPRFSGHPSYKCGNCGIKDEQIAALAGQLKLMTKWKDAAVKTLREKPE
jgi:hypothetical protein